MNYKIKASRHPEFDGILTKDALNFIVTLHQETNTERKRLLQQRQETQSAIDNGSTPDFLTDRTIRDSQWQVDPVPADIQDRRVEITGPTNRKMVINALNSGASVFMADFEDSNSPTWTNMVEGQINLRDAVNKTIEFTNPAGKHYKLDDDTATVFVRARGIHLPERHLIVDGEPISGAIFDFGLYFYHNANTLLSNGTGPYFYLPKLQNHHETRWWNNVFEQAQDMLGICRGTIKATMLLEHILAAFETEEMLYELRSHSAGLNCGRWDYIFSYIKVFRERSEYILPDRSQITMSSPFMNAYCREVIRACHKRGAHAMGGMAAQIPIKNDPAANEAALSKVVEDKEREVDLGHDGTWVAHPGLVSIAFKAFEKMITPNQLDKQRDETISAAEILEVPKGTITEGCLRSNAKIGVQYLEAWIRGNGCVPLYNLMEDAATAEISRSQVWQWIKHNCEMTNGEKITPHSFGIVLSEELKQIEKEIGKDRYASGRFPEAANMFKDLSTAKDLADFLTLPAYELL